MELDYQTGFDFQWLNGVLSKNGLKLEILIPNHSKTDQNGGHFVEIWYWMVVNSIAKAVVVL